MILAGRTSLTWTFVVGAGEGNRTPTVSLGNVPTHARDRSDPLVVVHRRDPVNRLFPWLMAGESRRRVLWRTVVVTRAAGSSLLHMLQGIMQVVQVRSQLLPLLRTPLLGELLAWVYSHPDELWSVTDLARRFNASLSTVSREADRLVESDFITERRRGNLRLLQADVQSPLARPLTDLLALTYGPKAVLGDVLATIRGVEEAYIYGSWAARYSGEAGPVPRDIDVLVVGDADDDAIFDAARVAERASAARSMFAGSRRRTGKAPRTIRS